VGVRQRPVEDVGDDLHVAVRVRAEAAAGGDAVVVEDAQAAEAHVLGVVVVGERERVPAVEPAEDCLSPPARGSDADHGVLLSGHGASRHRFTAGRGRPKRSRSTDSAPGPTRINRSMTARYTVASSADGPVGLTNGCPMGMWTMPRAAIMVKARPAAAIGVNSPRIKATPPPNSVNAAIAWRKPGTGAGGESGWFIQPSGPSGCWILPRPCITKAVPTTSRT